MKTITKYFIFFLSLALLGLSRSGQTQDKSTWQQNIRRSTTTNRLPPITLPQQSTSTPQFQFKLPVSQLPPSRFLQNIGKQLYQQMYCHAPDDCRMMFCSQMYFTTKYYTENSNLPKKFIPTLDEGLRAGQMPCYGIPRHELYGEQIIDLLRYCTIDVDRPDRIDSRDWFGLEGCKNPYGQTLSQGNQFLIFYYNQDVESFNQQTAATFDPNSQYVICYRPNLIEGWTDACFKNSCATYYDRSERCSE